MTTTTANVLTTFTDADLTEEITYQQRMLTGCTTAKGIEWRTERLTRAQAEQNRRIAANH